MVGRPNDGAHQRSRRWLAVASWEASSIEENLSMRQFRFRRHVRSDELMENQWGAWESRNIIDIRQARMNMNETGFLCDYQNKEIQWIRPESIAETGAYVPMPRGSQEHVRYPHGFAFTSESPILNLVPQRLMVHSPTENICSNGYWVSYICLASSSVHAFTPVVASAVRY